MIFSGRDGLFPHLPVLFFCPPKRTLHYYCPLCRVTSGGFRHRVAAHTIEAHFLTHTPAPTHGRITSSARSFTDRDCTRYQSLYYLLYKWLHVLIRCVFAWIGAFGSLRSCCIFEHKIILEHPLRSSGRTRQKHCGKGESMPGDRSELLRASGKGRDGVQAAERLPGNRFAGQA